jgi:aminopeptidase N
MLRGILGDEVFWKGIRTYYARYMNGSATTADFIRVMEETSGQDLKPFFDQWLYKPGALRVKGNWSYNATRKELEIQLDQEQTDGSLFTMPIQVSFALPGKTIPVQRTIILKDKSNRYTFPAEAAPTEVLLDPEHWVLMDAEFLRK